MSEYGEPWRTSMDGPGLWVENESGEQVHLSHYQERDRIVACVNSLAGIPNPEAVRELIEAAKAIADEYPNLSTPKHTMRLCNAVVALSAPSAGPQQK